MGKVIDAGWGLCDVCYVTFVPVTDPDDLQYYVHLHLEPEELIAQLTVEALHTYLADVIQERWPAQLIGKYGVDQVRQTLMRATALHGLAFERDGIRTPAAYLRWLLTGGATQNALLQASEDL